MVVAGPICFRLKLRLLRGALARGPYPFYPNFQYPSYPRFRYFFIPIFDTLFIFVSDTIFIQVSDTLFNPVSDTLFIPVSDTLFIPVSVPALSKTISTPASNAAMYSCNVPCPLRQNKTLQQFIRMCFSLLV